MIVNPSPLRYPGGKVRFYNYIKSILEINGLINETYIEPFAGGAGLALKLLINNNVKRIVINDFDPAIFSFWNCVLNYSDDLCSLIQKTEITVDEWKKQKQVYELSNVNDPLRLGFATLYLNRTNISGVMKGGIIGGHDQKGNFLIDARFNKEQLIKKIKIISELRERIIISNLDAKEFLSKSNLRRYYNVFINMDPPYVKKGAQLYKNSYIESDHRELSRIIKTCNRKWIVTYDVCPLVSELYHEYRGSYLDVTYSTSGARKTKEYIFFCDKLDIPNVIDLFNTGHEAFSCLEFESVT